MAERSEGTGLTPLGKLHQDLTEHFVRAKQKAEAEGYAQGLVHGYNEGYLDGLHNRQPKYAPHNPTR